MSYEQESRLQLCKVRLDFRSVRLKAWKSLELLLNSLCDH